MGIEYSFEEIQTNFSKGKIIKNVEESVPRSGISSYSDCKIQSIHTKRAGKDHGGHVQWKWRNVNFDKLGKSRN